MQTPSYFAEPYPDPDEASLGLAHGHSAGSSSSHRLRLAMAAELARAGQYDQAERLLVDRMPDGPLQTAALDLRGRILAQQGRYLEAQACWMQALSMDPANGQYREAMSAIAEGRVTPPVLRWVIFGFVGMIAFWILLHALDRGFASIDRRIEALGRQMQMAWVDTRTGPKDVRNGHGDTETDWTDPMAAFVGPPVPVATQPLPTSTRAATALAAGSTSARDATTPTPTTQKTDVPASQPAQ